MPPRAAGGSGRPSPRALLVVGRLAQPQVAEPSGRFQVVHAHGVRRQVGLHALPRVVPKVEGELQLGVERAEREREQALVARGADEDADRAQPVAEEPHSLLERPRSAEPERVELDREVEPRRDLFRPATELILGRNPVTRRVQLDARQPLGVVAQELGRLDLGRVEAGPPRWIGPAGSADIGPR